jgi:hypothetical protein
LVTVTPANVVGRAPEPPSAGCALRPPPRVVYQQTAHHLGSNAEKLRPADESGSPVELSATEGRDRTNCESGRQGVVSDIRDWPKGPLEIGVRDRDEARPPGDSGLLPDYFRVHNVPAIMFPTTILPARPIGQDDEVELNGKKMPTLALSTRTTPAR